MKNFDANYRKFTEHYANYLKDRIEALSTKGPSRRLYFLESDTNALFDAFDIEPKEIVDIIKDVPGLDSSWVVAANPFNVFCSCLVSHFHLHRNDYKRHSKLAQPHEVFSFYLTCRLYAVRHVKYYKYLPDEEIMDYTIEHLSKRFLVKKMGTMLDILVYLSDMNIETFKNGLDDQTDFFINRYLINLNNKINSMMKNIREEFDKNHKKQKRIGTDVVTATNSEGEEFYTDVVNISSEIEKMGRKIRIKLSSDSTVDIALLDLATRRTKISKNKMAVIMNKIRSDDTQLLYEMLLRILSFYIKVYNKNAQDVKSAHFFVSMSKSYGVSNTNNQFIMRIKEILDIFLKKYSEEYAKSSRKATESNMRNTIYLYIILYIQKNS